MNHFFLPNKTGEKARSRHKRNSLNFSQIPLLLTSEPEFPLVLPCNALIPPSSFDEVMGGAGSWGCVSKFPSAVSFALGFLHGLQSLRGVTDGLQLHTLRDAPALGLVTSFQE